MRHYLSIYVSKHRKLYKSLKNIFGFYPGNIFLYIQALRHKSLLSSKDNKTLQSNERLEYLGDSVLNTIVASYLFSLFPCKNEGFLTEMRSKLVSRNQLNKMATNLGIDTLINSSLTYKEGSATIKGNALEALIGAIFLDKGYEFTTKVVINRIIKANIDIEELEKMEYNFKSKMIEWAQKEKKSLAFTIINITELKGRKEFLVGCFINGELIDQGIGHSIKIAEQEASRKTFLKIDEIYSK